MLPSHQKLGQKILALQARLEQQQATAGGRSARSSSASVEAQAEEEEEEEEDDNMDWACGGGKGEEGMDVGQEAKAAVAAAVVRYRPSSEGIGKGGLAPMEEGGDGGDGGGKSLQTLHQVRWLLIS